ncbi:MAG: gfo/Idh/MocA family oxidoreductase [Acidobacteria bacterium]|nr:MAG: gfo/Idh/MocA family oxidoreductase [Acidobacteriota bacterium]
MSPANHDTPLRFALIGAGRIGMTHLEALAGCPGTALVAIVEPREAVGAALAEENRCLHLADWQDPRLAKLCDAAIICTPPVTHHPIARSLLEAGCHVLCEKPLTIEHRHAQELAETARAHGAVLMMASKFRFVDDVIKAKAIVEAGILGRVVFYENAFCAFVDMSERWNADPEIAGGGVLIDNGTHALDLARFLLGSIRDVHAQRGLPVQKLPVEDSVRVMFRSGSGVVGLIDLSWSLQKETDAYVSLYGTEGTLHIGWAGSRYRQRGHSQWIPFGRGYDKLAAFRRQIENFRDTIRGHDRPVITPEAAVLSVRAVEAAYASIEGDRWVPIEDAG